MRINKFVAVAAASAFMAGGVSTAAVALDPGPNGPNTFGLCTAYFAGSERGQEEKRKAPPFQGLEAAAEAADQTVEQYCAENGQHPGNGGGQGQGKGKGNNG